MTAPAEWVIDLPVPRPPLSANERMHWSKSGPIVKQLRFDACRLAMHAHLPQGLDRVRVELHWAPTMRRRRDASNFQPTLKAVMDGLVDYGLVADDDSEHVEEQCYIDPVGRFPLVWLRIVDLSGVRPGVEER